MARSPLRHGDMRVPAQRSPPSRRDRVPPRRDRVPARRHARSGAMTCAFRHSEVPPAQRDLCSGTVRCPFRHGDMRVPAQRDPRSGTVRWPLWRSRCRGRMQWLLRRCEMAMRTARSPCPPPWDRGGSVKWTLCTARSTMRAPHHRRSGTARSLFRHRDMRVLALRSPPSDTVRYPFRHSDFAVAAP